MIKTRVHNWVGSVGWLAWVVSGWFGLVWVGSGWFGLVRVSSGLILF